jgi:arylformamidase
VLRRNEVMSSRIKTSRAYAFASVIVFAATMALTATAVRAQSAPPSTAPATTRPAQTPVLAENTVLRADVPYGSVGDALNVIDIYSPKDASGAPILIFIHGGEWSRGDKHDVSTKPKFFNEHGVVFIAVNYRLSPKYKHPAQVDDVATAIAWTRQHAGEFGGDPNKIVIMGHSAGCHLVTLVSLDPDPLAKVGMKASDLRGVIAWSGGMYDLVARAKGGGMYPPFINATFGETSDAQKAGSPLTYVANARSGPPFLITSVDDARSQSSRDASAELTNAINANGGTAKQELLVGKSHFTANHELGAAGDQSGFIALQFIESVTK